ncbi:hypothetical protein ABW636_03480 [Aquimarina sp. 2201CG1-2-11]|uniref:hypothetical protein n=1 Tax=Aquimarina discodermiae TaxID=3231043 RepID=UPI0034623740
MKIKFIIVFIIFLFVSKLTVAQNQEQDRKEIDKVVSSLYKAISFGKGETPDYDLLNDIHFSEAVVGVVDTTKIKIFTEEEFRTANKVAFKKHKVISFHEKEIHEITHVYGGVAVRFSSYEFTIKLENKQQTIRGVNTIQLVKKPKGTWVIYSVIFSDNRSYPDVPSIYLKK